MIGVKRGFTILELLAVMAIIAILAALGAKGYSLARRQAKESRAMADIEKLRTALSEYRVEYGRFPELDGDGGFVDMADLGRVTNLVKDVVLTDPWGNSYQYVCTNRFLYRIWSRGQDGVGGTEDDIEPSRAGY